MHWRYLTAVSFGFGRVLGAHSALIPHAHPHPAGEPRDLQVLVFLVFAGVALFLVRKTRVGRHGR